jgi:hypothetical protein
MTRRPLHASLHEPPNTPWTAPRGSNTAPLGTCCLPTGTLEMALQVTHPQLPVERFDHELDIEEQRAVFSVIHLWLNALHDWRFIIALAQRH